MRPPFLCYPVRVMWLGRIFHVFRNTPNGRETLGAAARLCRATGLQLHLWIPEETRFALQLENDLVEIPLDDSYRVDPETAREHAISVLSRFDVAPHWAESTHLLASTMPVIQARYHLMSCPRVLSTAPVGALGNRVRQLVRMAPFPIAIFPSPAPPWDRLAVFFGGSSHALRALAWARWLADHSDLPLEVITHDEGNAVERCAAALEEAGLLEEIQPVWRRLKAPSFHALLWEVAPTSLVVAAAFGHAGVKARLFGSRTEILQAHLPNSLLLVGPRTPGPGA